MNHHSVSLGEKGYQELISKVRAIDPKAAEYLDNGARTLETFSPGDSLIGCFIWDESPQRHEYWSHIREDLEKDLRRRRSGR
jgi:hypothetical protein